MVKVKDILRLYRGKLESIIIYKPCAEQYDANKIPKVDMEAEVSGFRFSNYNTTKTMVIILQENGGNRND